MHNDAIVIIAYDDGRDIDLNIAIIGCRFLVSFNLFCHQQRIYIMWCACVCAYHIFYHIFFLCIYEYKGKVLYIYSYSYKLLIFYNFINVSYFVCADRLADTQCTIVCERYCRMKSETKKMSIKVK